MNVAVTTVSRADYDELAKRFNELLIAIKASKAAKGIQRHMAGIRLEHAIANAERVQPASPADANRANDELIASLKFCRSVLANLPPAEMSERMAIEQADAALSRATGAQ